MRQRNTSGYPLSLPTLAQVLHPGEDIEHDRLIAGCTLVVDGEGDQDSESGDGFGESGASADGCDDTDEGSE